MGIIQLDAYIFLLSGSDRFTFLDGLSTNKVEESCSTVLTTTNAKIIDVIDVVEVGETAAIIGYGPYREKVLHHLQPRILQQDVAIRDITNLNRVYLSTEPPEENEGGTQFQSYLGWLIIVPPEENEGGTQFQSYLGWLIIVSKDNPIETTMTQEEFTDYRIENLLPLQGYEISEKFHPFNCGLEHLVHEAKGCYIGQEVLTRMRSRGNMGRQLMRVPRTAEDATSVGTKGALAIRRQ